MTLKTDQNTAHNYAVTIGNEILALENVLDGSKFASSEEQAAEMRELLETMASESGESVEDYAPNVIEYLNSFCLEFVATGEKRSDGWTVTGTKSLRTYGGPNCWIETEGTEFLFISVYWGGESVRRSIYAPTVTSALNELGEM